MPRILFGRVARTVGATVALTLIAGGLAYANATQKISLSVDGTTTEVSAEVGTVREILAQAGVTVSARDQVFPALDSVPEAGDGILVRRARPLRITLDGRKQVYWTTAGTVGEAVDMLGLHRGGARRAMRMSVPRATPIGRDGVVMHATTPKPVTLVVDGTARRVVTTADNVRQLLAEEGVTTGPRDEVSASFTSPLVAGLIVKLWHVKVKRLTKDRKIGYRTSKKKTNRLYQGRSRVANRGRSGVRRTVYEVVLIRGVEKDRRVVSNKVVRKPVNRVVHVGTKPRRGAGAIGRLGGLNWSALAKCESGGRVNAVSRNGRYRGLYQFSQATWNSVGGNGRPDQASAQEQTYRAWKLYQRTGARSWPHCGCRLFT